MFLLTLTFEVYSIFTYPQNSGFIFLPPGIVMNTFCAPHTCSGQAGVHGNVAQLNVEEGFRPATEPARMALNVLAAML